MYTIMELVAESNKRRIEDTVSGSYSDERNTREKTYEEIVPSFLNQVRNDNNDNEIMEVLYNKRTKKDRVSPETVDVEYNKVCEQLISYVPKKAKHATDCSSSFPSEEKEKNSSDLREFTEMKAETVSSPVAVRGFPLPPKIKRGTVKALRFDVAVDLVEKVVAFYNDEAKKNEERMKAVRIKEALSQWEEHEQIDFVCFDAKLTSKDGKESRETNCRSVLFVDAPLGSPRVVSFDHGSLKDEDIKKWTMKRGYRCVLYSESIRKMGNKEEEDSDSDGDGFPDSESEGNGNGNGNGFGDSGLDEESIENSDSEDNMDKEADSDSDSDSDMYDDCVLFKVDVNLPQIQKFAEEVVADYNAKKGPVKMELGEVKEALTRCVGREYHINFDADLIDADGNKIKTPYQAVVSHKSMFPIKVLFLREGNGNEDKWCNEHNCACVFPLWERPSNGDLIKYKYPEWCLPLVNEEGGQEKMKPESSNQPPAASTCLENLGSTWN